jgi:hypothetical protein
VGCEENPYIVLNVGCIVNTYPVTEDRYDVDGCVEKTVPLVIVGVPENND